MPLVIGCNLVVIHVRDGTGRNAHDTRQHLLVPPLHGAVPLEEVHHVAVAVGQDLDLHVARVDDEPAGGLGLESGSGIVVVQWLPQ